MNDPANHNPPHTPDGPPDGAPDGTPDDGPRSLPTRVGCVRYLNTVPLIEGLQGVRGFELDAAVPARLIEMLVGPNPSEADPTRAPAEPLGPPVDIALISIIDAAASPVPLTLIPAGMIGCDGPTLTVRLFSRVPFDRVTRLHADTDSHTSVALSRVLFARTFGVRPEVVPFDARERVAHTVKDTDPTAPIDPAQPADPDNDGWPETLLLIGDKVVTDSPPAIRYPHQLDLGEAWKDLTGLPFAYAVWACRRENRERPAVRTAATVLDRQRRRNAARLDWIIARRSAGLRWPLDLARRYFGDYLRFEVTPAVRTAAQRFIDEAAAMGVVPETTLDWMDLDQPASGTAASDTPGPGLGPGHTAPPAGP